MNIGEAFVSLKLDSKKLVSGLKQAKTHTEKFDKTGKKTTKSISGGFDKMGKASSKFASIAKKALLAGGVLGALYALKRGLSAGLSEFAKFEKGLANIAILLNKNIAPAIRRFGQGIKNIAMKFGVATQQLTASLFDIQSATGDTANALEILESATQLAVAGGSNLTDTISGLLTLMTSYGSKLKGVADAADLLFVTQKKARATIGELSSAVGEFLPIGSLLEINIDELMAVFAQLTVGLGNVSQSATSLQGILSGFLKPTEMMKEWAEEEYEMTIQNAVAKKGLTRILKDLAKVEKERIGQMMPRIEGIKALGVAFYLQKQIEETVLEIEKRHGITQEALQIQMDTTRKKLDKLSSSWGLLKIRIGETAASAGLIGFLAKEFERFNKVSLGGFKEQEEIAKIYIKGIEERITKAKEEGAEEKEILVLQKDRANALKELAKLYKDMASYRDFGKTEYTEKALGIYKKVTVILKKITPELKKIEKAEKKITDEAKAYGEAYAKEEEERRARIETLEKIKKRVAEEDKRNAEEGIRIWEETRTPLEKYVIQLDRLKYLFAERKIDLETYSRATQKLWEDAKEKVVSTTEEEIQIEKTKAEKIEEIHANLWADIQAGKLMATENAMTAEITQREATNEAMLELVQGYNNAVIELAKAPVTFMKEGINTFSSSVGDAIGKMATGMQSWGEGIKNVGKALQGMMAKFIADLVTAIIKATILSAIMKTTGIGGILGGIFHEGGIVKAHAGINTGLMKAHSGLDTNEIPIIAQRGEGILPISAMRQLGAGGFEQLRKGNVGGGSQTTISIDSINIDASGADSTEIAENIANELNLALRGA